MVGLFFIHFDYKKRLIKYNKLYISYLLLIWTILTIILIYTKHFHISNSTLETFIFLGYISTCIISVRLITIFLAPKGHRIQLVIKEILSGFIIEGSTFVISLVTLRVLLKEIRLQFYKYRFVWMIALLIPIILSVIKYYKKKFNYLQSDNNIHTLILYLIFKLEIGPNKHSISNQYIQHLLNKSNDASKNNIKLLFLLTLIESFSAVYISLAFILYKYLSPMNNNILILDSVIISLMSLTIIYIIFHIIKILLRSLYEKSYHPSHIFLRYCKLTSKFIKIICFIIYKLLEALLIIIYRKINGRFTYLLNIYRLNKIITKLNPSQYLLENNLIKVLQALIDVDKKEDTHCAMVFLYTWAINNNLKMRLGLGINKNKIIKKINKHNNPKYKIDFIILSKSHLIFPYSNNWNKYFLIDPRINWNNKSAKKYVLNLKENFNCNNSLDKRFKHIVNYIIYVS